MKNRNIFNRWNLRNTLLSFLLPFFFFFTSIMVYSQFWSSVGGGTASWVNALAVYNGELVVGTDNGIIKWDGNSWSNLGTGINGTVDALCVYNGILYAGGGFTLAGGVEVSNVAAWNGTAWSDPEGGTNSLVVAMTVYNNELVIGGYFTSANGPANHVAKWDGENWSPLGSGTVGTEGQVMALTVYNGDLVAGGFFTTAGGLPANHIAKWNGTSWSALGSGIGHIVYALTVYNNQLIAGGLFSSAGGVPANAIASWNGTAWSPLGSGIGGGLYPYVLGLAVQGNYLYAGGLYQHAGGITCNGAAKWDGTTWAPMNGGFTSPGNVAGAYAVCVYNNDVAFGGIFTGAGGVNSANVVLWTDVQVPANLAIENITINATENLCFDATQSITVAGNNTFFHVMNSGSVTMIAGENILMLPGTQVDAGSYFHAYITQTGQYCGSLPVAPSPKATIEGTPESNVSNSGFSIFPNPARGEISIVNDDQSGMPAVAITIFNSTGKMIFNRTFNQFRDTKVRLENQLPGIYLVRISTGNETHQYKVIRQ